ncbi:hypothetical protein SAMN05421824_2418 [Hyunsoonleella jejuensis]|uniref:NIPSNAP protein n=1 Tax=Hyunsoonleella jejuensis TaxID=419940 RepID=A0A1H9J7G1_9FLAO|nr:hypothetical protein [Hyunsoonleella jejuensis]SEQ82679.1 hypothetical protein SAMN05421824_2418 [Hyunsoonleella jejuensis]
MIRSTFSFLVMVCLVFSASLSLSAQDESKDNVLESIMMTPDYKDLKTLGENMRAHNAKYHKDGPYKARVYNISTGPNAGSFVWMMGPTTYTHLDKRPTNDGHDEDWRDNVMPFIKKIHTVEFWKMDNELSNMSMMDGDDAKHPVIFVRYHEIKDGEIPGAFSFLEYVSKTLKAMEGGKNPWGVYVNEFRQGDLGRHIATVGFLKNWAEMDEEGENFKDVFEKTHGANKWQFFLDLGDRSFSNSWDEIWSYNAYMSGK